MNVLDFLSDVDRENYFKEYKENVDVYITAFNYVRDKLKDEDKNRAVSINLITDSGFESFDWSEYNL